LDILLFLWVLVCLNILRIGKEKTDEEWMVCIEDT
jgi:hypothetical protein